MIETGITPDFIVVDGKEGGTGAAPLEFIDHMGMPLRDGLVFVHYALVGAGLRDRIKLGASGKITSAFDMARVMALGADWCNAARGFMFAVGCIQAQRCHTGLCPTGVATQDPLRQRAIVVQGKSASAIRSSVQEPGGDRTDQADDRYGREPVDRAALSAQNIAVEILHHIENLVAEFLVEVVISQVQALHAEEITRLRLIRHLGEPVALREAHERFLQAIRLASECDGRPGAPHFQLLDGGDQAIGQHQQCRLVEMTDEEEQEILMAELAEQSALVVLEAGGGAVGDDREGMA